VLDPNKIPQEDLPLIVFSDHSSGLIQSIIKIRTKGYYNHVMWMHREGLFASQGNTYSEVAVKRYMKKGNRLKFITIGGLTDTEKLLILASIKKKLALPWYRKIYDWFGILGQIIGFKKVSTPGLDYCSEDVPRHLRAVSGFVAQKDIRQFIAGLPHHGSPEDLNKYIKEHPECATVYGRWDSDEKEDLT